MGTRRAVDAVINIRRGDTKGVETFAQAEKAIAAARAQVEQFSRKGGLAAFAVGADRIEYARAQVENLALSLVNVEREAAQARVALENSAQGSTAWEKAVKQLSDAETAAAGIRKELAQLPTDLRESVREVTGFLGDIDTAFQTTASAIGQIGSQVSGVFGGQLAFDSGPLGALAQGIAGLGEAAAVGEQLFILSSSMSDLTAKGAKAISSMTGLTVSTTALGVAAAAVVAIVAVISSINERNERAVKALEAAYEARDRAAQDSLTLTQAQVDAERQAIQARLEILQNDEVIQAARAQQDQIDSLNLGWFSGLAAALDGNSVNAELAASILEDANSEIADLSTRLRELDNASNQASIALNTQIEAIVADGEQRAKTAEDIRRLTTDQAQDELELNRLRQESLRGTLGQLRELGTPQAAEEIAALNEQLNDLTTREAALTDEILPAVRVREEEAAAAERASAAIGDHIAALGRQVDFLSTAAEDAANLSSEDAQSRVAALDAEREAIQSILPELMAKADQDEQYAEELARQRDRLSQISEETAHYNDVLLPAIQAREDLVNAVQEEIAAENELFEQRQRESKLQKDLTAIADQANKARTQVNDTLATALDTMTSGIADAEDKGKAALAKLDKEWMQAQLKDQAKFIKEEQRQRSDANKELLRAQQDAFLAMREAEESNDVIAFIQAQRRSEQDLQRQQEDIDTEAQRRADDRATEMQEAQAAREAKIAEIQMQTQAEIASIQQRYQESTQQAQKRLEEIDAQEQAQAQARRARDDEEAKAREEQQKRLADQQRRLDEAQAEGTRRAHQLVMEAVSRSAQATAQTAQEAFTKTVQGVGTAVQSVFTQLQSAVTRIQSAASSALSSRSSGSNDYLSGRAASSNPVTAGVNRAVSTVTGAITGAAARSNAAAGITSAITGAARTLGLRSFAEPGVATAPTLGVFGDRPDNIPEAVIPFPPATARALARGEGFGGQPVTVNLNAPIGDGVSRQEVHAELMAFGRIIAQGFPV